MPEKSNSWLNFWALANAALGAGFVVMAAIPAVDLPLRLLADIVLWPFDGQPASLSAEARLMTVIGGGVLAGWGVLMARLFGGATGPAETQGAITQGLAVWFVLDSLGSIAVGAWPNVLLNIVILAGFLVPLRSGRAAEGRNAT